MDINRIKQLRQMTGVGMVEAKTVLDESNGDVDAAVKLLRTRGLKAATKRAGRTASEGTIGCYLHSNGKVAVMVELLCETDFVARNEDFKKLAKDIAMHIAAMNPQYLGAEDVPEEDIQKEREIYKGQIQEDSNKPQEIQDKIIEGKLAKFYDETCLLQQNFVKDEGITIEQLVQGAIQKIGEKIEIGRFERYVL